MGRCRGVPFEFPNILHRLLSSPRRAGGRTNKMNSNTYSNNNYKSNERALADLLGQLVRGRNNSPPGYGRGGVGGSSGGSGPINNYGGSSMGPNGGGSGGLGSWGINAPNDWNPSGGSGGSGYGNSGRGGGGGGAGYGNSGSGGGGSGNRVPLMQRGGGDGGGFGGMPQGGGMNDVYGGMPQGGGMNNNFGGMQQGNNYMGMSGGNQGGFGGMPPNRGMNNAGFGSGGGGGNNFPQNNNFGGAGFDNCPPPPPGRSRGTWVSGAANRSNRNLASQPVRNSSRSSSSTQDRRNLGGSKTSLSSKGSRSGGASTSGNTSKSVQALKRKAPPNSAPPAKLSTNADIVKRTSAQANQRSTQVNQRSTQVNQRSTQANQRSAQANKTSAAEPRRVLTSTGGRWYQHFLSKGLKPEEARKKAFENNNKPFTVGAEGATAAKSVKKTNPPPAETYIRLAIFAKGFPEVILETDDLSALEERIVDEVANSSTESKLQFERLLRKPGLMVVDCVNQNTADWLIDTIPKLNWESTELAICYEEDIPDAYIMTLSLPRSAGQDYDQTLSLIQSQNTDLATDSWEWVQEREDGDRSILTIRVDKESHAAIKAKKWKIFYKFGLIEVNFARYIRFALSKRLNEVGGVEKTKIKGEKSVGEGDKETTAETTDENPPSPPPAPIISK
ncbi:uncharacterized protein [Bactrocera oleae]|uniref:uncharacterized protein n=1 Tax=Bactrocera oleae TaxID=104688 RepID=UPI00387EA7F8